MDRQKKAKKIRGRGAKGSPPKTGENRYVITFEDTRAYRGKIVAVAGFPAPGFYAKVVAQADEMKELKRDLRILGLIDGSDRECDTVTVHVYPGLDVCCYVNVSKERPKIIRKGENPDGDRQTGIDDRSRCHDCGNGDLDDRIRGAQDESEGKNGMWTSNEDRRSAKSLR